MLINADIPGLEGIETIVESTKRPIGSLRTAEGCIPYPAGGLTTGLQWKSLWGLSDFSTQVKDALSAADPTKAHFVEVENNSHKLLCVYSLALDEPLGLWYLEGDPEERDFDVSGSTTFTTVADAVYQDKDDNTTWFGSRIADMIYFGNGIDPNLRWKDGALGLLEPDSEASIYNKAKEAFPACTVFAMDDQHAIYATGNVAQPLRVWIGEEPTQDFPLNEGIYSSVFSYIDITLDGATKTTGLSTWNNYMTVDTDEAPVNLFGLDRSTDGYKCEQKPSGANRGAYNPTCRMDNKGFASFYLGTDGELYHDHAVRGGNHFKFFEKQVATRKAIGNWNRAMLKEPIGRGYHCIYDRSNGLFFIFARLRVHGVIGMWCYNEKTNALAGPVRYPDALVSTAMQHVDSDDGSVDTPTDPTETILLDLGDGSHLDLGDGTLLRLN